MLFVCTFVCVCSCVLCVVPGVFCWFCPVLMIFYFLLNSLSKKTQVIPLHFNEIVRSTMRSVDNIKLTPDLSSKANQIFTY